MVNVGPDSLARTYEPTALSVDGRFDDGRDLYRYPPCDPGVEQSPGPKAVYQTGNDDIGTRVSCANVSHPRSTVRCLQVNHLLHPLRSLQDQCSGGMHCPVWP